MAQVTQWEPVCAGACSPSMNLIGIGGETSMSDTDSRGRPVPAALTFSQRESIRMLGIALRKLYKSYLKEPRRSGFSP